MRSTTWMMVPPAHCTSLTMTLAVRGGSESDSSQMTRPPRASCLQRSACFASGCRGETRPPSWAARSTKLNGPGITWTSQHSGSNPSIGASPRKASSRGMRSVTPRRSGTSSDPPYLATTQARNFAHRRSRASCRSMPAHPRRSRCCAVRSARSRAATRSASRCAHSRSESLTRLPRSSSTAASSWSRALRRFSTPWPHSSASSSMVARQRCAACRTSTSSRSRSSSTPSRSSRHLCSTSGTKSSTGTRGRCFIFASCVRYSSRALASAFRRTRLSLK
mmetsp:Transcript_28526/g.96050  ORF Transcript_28526/g.96050 Transcript_28526/m.96050 type:complete len:278 (+) Transcript_28526:93-926(+)